MTSLATESLVFVYPDGTRALDGVSLQIGGGEAVGIIGQNGSGKSTLIRHFNGLLRATEGRVLLDGQNVNERHVAELARIVAVTFQNPDRQIFAGRIGSEVAFGPRNLGVRGTDLEQRVEEALKAVDLGPRGAANPYDLGFSQRKLLALASVIAMETPVVILDEPTTGQDARGLERVRSIVRRLVGAGRTVVVTSHDMRFVAETMERVVVLRDGQVILDGPPEEVFAADRWPLLGTTHVEAPWAAQEGARLGLGSTPTEASLFTALQAWGGQV
ncbi:MAG: ABC transporter ATP-binding protein [Chloroflexi bacterium]|nr:MAG: ABC transporter ATP-binding protein [Chloroflexota bacterium]